MGLLAEVSSGKLSWRKSHVKQCVWATFSTLAVLKGPVCRNGNRGGSLCRRKDGEDRSLLLRRSAKSIDAGSSPSKQQRAACISKRGSAVLLPSIGDTPSMEGEQITTDALRYPLSRYSPDSKLGIWFEVVDPPSFHHTCCQDAHPEVVECRALVQRATG